MTLEDLGIDPSRIVISTQTLEDYNSYVNEYSRYTVIFGPKDSAGGNRNNLIDYFSDNNISTFVLLDDDVRGVICKDGNKAKNINKNNFMRLLEYMYKCMDEYNSPIAGIFKGNNPFYMKDEVKTRDILSGQILIFKSNKFRFNERYILAENAEISCQLLKLGYNVLCFRNIAPLADRKTPGGCSEAREYGKHVLYYVNMLIKEYSMLPLYKTKYDGVSIRRR